MSNSTHSFSSTRNFRSQVRSKFGKAARRLSVLTLATFLIFLGFAYKADAADVILDFSFGTSGVLINPLESVATDMALQSDGKIVVVGTVSFSNDGFRLVRYNSNGSLDTTFGTGGVVTTTFPNQNHYAGANSVAIQPDGKIVAGGYVRINFTNEGFDFAVARYNTNGILDTSFGAGGTVTANFGNNADRIEDIALQADGKIVCVGWAYAAIGQPQYDLAMARFNSNGAPDNSFGTAGKVVSQTTFGERGYAVAVQSDGKIVVGGYIINLNTIEDFAIARYNDNGTFDAGFGTGGLASIDYGTSSDGVEDLTIQPDGKIVVIGHKVMTTGYFVITRLNVNGTVDAGFAASPPNETIGSPSLALQSDGKIVVGGTVSGNGGDFGLVRFLSDGTLDPSFDGDGRTSANLGHFNPTTDNLKAIAIQSDGKIVAAGTSGGFSGGSSFEGISLARFQTTARLPARPYDFDGDGRADLGVLRPGNGTWYVRLSSDGSLFALKWGESGDMPEPADFDGDGRNDFVIFRSGAWYVVSSGTGAASGLQFGTANDIPVAADYDGDAKADFAVFRPSNGTWYILRSSDSVLQVIQLGTNGDKPVPGDYSGDGKSDVAVWRPSTGTWYTSLNPATNFDAFVWGQNGDVPVPGDYDGDGKNDRAIFRPSTATWWIYYASNGSYVEKQFGTGTDRPVPADYDGDGTTNIAVFRLSNGLWYTSLDPGTNYGAQLWGQAGDVPIESSNVP